MNYSLTPQIVQVYRNLHRKCWSIRDKRTRRVIAHAKNVTIASPGKTPLSAGVGVLFRVSELGRQRVLRDKRKNVHAFIEGYLYEAGDHFVDRHNLDGPIDWDVVKYNPYKGPTFRIGDTEHPVLVAEFAFLHDDGSVVAGNVR